MLSERMLTAVVRQCTKQYLKLEPTTDRHVPAPVPGQRYMLYLHVPFCERLCPYCSFNRFPFAEERAMPYFANLRKEMLMLKDLGYDFDSVYVGGGTPTIMIDELCDTIDLARETFSIKEVSSETNPNHLIPAYLDKLQGRVQRLSVGVQSFDDGLLKQMDRYEKYGSGAEILERIGEAQPLFHVAQRGHDLQLPRADRRHPHLGHRARGGKRHQPDHVLPTDGVAFRGALARPHGGQGRLRTRAALLRDHRRAARRRRRPPVRSRQRLDVQQARNGRGKRGRHD